MDKHFRETDDLYGSVWELVEEKLEPIRKQIFAEYEKTEEYRVREYWRKEEKRIRDKMWEQRKREEAEKIRREEEEKRKQEQERRQNYESYSKWYKSFTSVCINIKNKELANELIKAGYRQLSKKYHKYY